MACEILRAGTDKVVKAGSENGFEEKSKSEQVDRGHELGRRHFSLLEGN